MNEDFDLHAVHPDDDRQLTTVLDGVDCGGGGGVIGGGGEGGFARGLPIFLHLPHPPPPQPQPPCHSSM